MALGYPHLALDLSLLQEYRQTINFYSFFIMCSDLSSPRGLSSPAFVYFASFIPILAHHLSYINKQYLSNLLVIKVTQVIYLAQVLELCVILCFSCLLCGQ